MHADISRTSMLVKIQKHDNTISMVFAITVISSAIDGIFLMLIMEALGLNKLRLADNDGVDDNDADDGGADINGVGDSDDDDGVGDFGQP